MTSSSKDTRFLFFRFLSLTGKSPGVVQIWQDLRRPLGLRVFRLSLLAGSCRIPSELSLLLGSRRLWALEFLTSLNMLSSRPTDVLQSSVSPKSWGGISSWQKMTNPLCLFVTASCLGTLPESSLRKLKMSGILKKSLVQGDSFWHSAAEKAEEGQRMGSHAVRLPLQPLLPNKRGAVLPVWSRMQKQVMGSSSSTSWIVRPEDINSCSSSCLWEWATHCF